MTDQQLKGLIGEVEEDDVYMMRYKENIVSINDPNYIHVHGHDRPFNFEPDVIFDLGANVGVFTRYCRKLFPNSRIIAVEPDDVNAASFLKNIPDSKVTFIKAGIGIGEKLYRANGAVNGSGECYLSKGLGYSNINKVDHYKETDIKIILLSDLIQEYVKEGEKYIIKMDIEGAENFVFQHEPSVKALLNADYVTAELHYFGMTGKQVNEVRKVTENVLNRFEDTHKVIKDNIYFNAVKLCK